MEGCTARGVKMNNWGSRRVVMWWLNCECGALSEEKASQREAIDAADGWFVRFMTYWNDTDLRILECYCPKCWYDPQRREDP